MRAHLTSNPHSRLIKAKLSEAYAVGSRRLCGGGWRAECVGTTTPLVQNVKKKNLGGLIMINLLDGAIVCKKIFGALSKQAHRWGELMIWTP